MILCACSKYWNGPALNVTWNTLFIIGSFDNSHRMHQSRYWLWPGRDLCRSGLVLIIVLNWQLLSLSKHWISPPNIAHHVYNRAFQTDTTDAFTQVRVQHSSLFQWFWAIGELISSILDVRPHLFYNRLFPSRFIRKYQIILLDDRSTCVNNLPRVITQQRLAQSWTGHLSIASPIEVLTGTASPSNCGLQLCPPRHSYKDSKVISGCWCLWLLCLALYRYTYSFIHSSIAAFDWLLWLLWRAVRLTV